jgi:hypothetical protein
MEKLMNSQLNIERANAPTVLHELYFASLYQPGRGVVVPCDEAGNVDLDSLSDRLRTTYLGARAMVGREYLHPTVHRSH